MKTPDQFNDRDWHSYLRQSIIRKTKKSFDVPASLRKLWSRTLSNLGGIDSFRIALAVDISDPLELKTEPWRTLDPAKVLYKFSGRSNAFWRAVWFSRYAQTKGEVQYYRYHLTQYEAGLEMDKGEPGRMELLKTSKRALAKSEEVIKGRGNPRPAFKMDWLAQRFD